MSGRRRSGQIGSVRSAHSMTLSMSRVLAGLGMDVTRFAEGAGAVARVRLAAAGAAVQEVDQHQQALPDDRVGLATLDVHHEAYPAGVVLVRGVVQALRGNLVGDCGRRLLLHASSPL